MTRPILFLLTALGVALPGCGTRPTALGNLPRQAAAITSVRDLRPATGTVTLRGIMVEKCPIAGCWFVLRDKTGAIKVDTKDAGFVVTEVPLGTPVTVNGRLAAGGERRIAAMGLRY